MLQTGRAANWFSSPDALTNALALWPSCRAPSYFLLLPASYSGTLPYPSRVGSSCFRRMTTRPLWFRQHRSRDDTL